MRPPQPTAEGEGAFEVYRRGGTTLEISLLIKMVLVVRRFRHQVDEELRLIGQSATRMEALGAIMNMQGAVTQTDLARRLRLESATITRVIDMLSAEGLVTRRVDPADRRIRLLDITPSGEAALAQIFEIYDAARGEVLRGIARSGMEQMAALLDDMLERLEHPVAAPAPA